MNDRHRRFARSRTDQRWFLVFDRLRVRKANVGQEARSDKRYGRHRHADDDHEALGFIVRPGDGDPFRSTGQILDDEAGRVLVC